jgi:hypothetical protein
VEPDPNDPSLHATPPPADGPPTEPPVPAEEARARGGLVWWIIVGSVTLLAVVVAGIVVALQPSAPSSADELQKLLIAPTGGAYLASGTAVPKASGPGVRWTVSRGWIDDGHRTSGVVSLTQYETADQAQAALARLSDQAPAARQSVPGHPGAFYLPGPTLPILGRSTQSGAGVGAKHTILAFVAGTGESPDVVIRLLAEQLDRLP